jgi:hypothetical protein
MPKGYPKPCNETIDLLDWKPTNPAIQFEPDEVKAQDLSTKISRAVSTALKQSTMAREEVADRMSEYLGTTVPVSALDAYASQEKDRDIPHTKLIALAYALKDWRLLSIGAEELDCIVVPREFAELIRLAQLAEMRRRVDEEISAGQHSIKKLGLVD